MNIEMTGIMKSFGTNQVLDNAGFFLRDGEVHALMGENGAGKSTLMKILTGVYTRDGGIVKVNGQEVNYSNPQEGGGCRYRIHISGAQRYVRSYG